MLGLLFLTALAIAIWGFLIGVKFSARAIGDAEGRAENIIRAVCGFLLAGFLTYPVVVGPLVARVACSFGVGLEINSRTDLRSNGYLVDWPGASGTRLVAQAVDDLLAGRIAFFETSSFSRNKGLQRVMLGPNDSIDCISPTSFGAERRPPKGMCIEVKLVSDRQSSYDLETSPGFWRTKSFQKSIKLVEHASGRVAASYTSRRIANARLDFGAVQCPRIDSEGGFVPMSAMTALALIKSEKPPGSAGQAAVAANTDVKVPACALLPMPENTEVHRYESRRGRQPIDIHIDNSGTMASENLVYVNRPGVPVVLWLSTSEPVVWRIRQTPDSQIAAVFAKSWESGVAVTGVRASVPLLISSGKYARMSNCQQNELTDLYRATVSKYQVASDVNGDKHYATGDETVPFVIGPKLREDAYEEYDDIPESRYSLK